MTTFTQPKTLTDLLLIEVATGWTKQRGTFAAGAEIPLGTVLALVNGQYQAVDPASADAAAKRTNAILAETLAASAATRKGTVIARGATVNEAALLWPAAITAPQKAAGVAELEARGIVARAVL
ncbi:head decoration protein [Lysobacter sp. CA199]|uniref:head decoration protein n=1 Tax=Lysobacter sp. CA199 TaxID=3455608 RepID=UPI003F8D60C8